VAVCVADLVGPTQPCLEEFDGTGRNRIDRDPVRGELEGSVFVMPTIPPLAVMYATMPEMTRMSAADVMLMMRPAPRGAIGGLRRGTRKSNRAD